MRIIVASLLTLCAVACAERTVDEQPPLPLPDDVRQSLANAAQNCDVLVLGEIHGTREVPAIVAGLLEPLNALGYRAIALEVPHDEQAAIEAWATGTTKTIPTFFLQPPSDGRGNEQLLAFVRSALRPPYEWTLICFDESEADAMQRLTERFPKGAEGNIYELAGKLTPDDMVALSNQRDAAMARYLAEGRANVPPQSKVVAICGNVHARTANHAASDSQLAALWPSLAANLKRDTPASRVLSINVRPFSGEFFNGGQVHKLGHRPLAQVEMRMTPDADWEAELNLPQATAATFLAGPASAGAAAQSASETPATK